MLLDIRRNMADISRALEAMPNHVNLPIVRFEDVFGESWALPFQACSEQRVSFPNTSSIIKKVEDKFTGDMIGL